MGCWRSAPFRQLAPPARKRGYLPLSTPSSADSAHRKPAVETSGLPLASGEQDDTLDLGRSTRGRRHGGAELGGPRRDRSVT